MVLRRDHYCQADRGADMLKTFRHLQPPLPWGLEFRIALDTRGGASVKCLTFALQPERGMQTSCLPTSPTDDPRLGVHRAQPRCALRIFLGKRFNMAIAVGRMICVECLSCRETRVPKGWLRCCLEQGGIVSSPATASSKSQPSALEWVPLPAD
jgi:hypothetical protein